MTEAEYNDLLNDCRAKCRAAEIEHFDNENNFKYAARTFWWEFLEKSQKYPVPIVMSFKDFWGNDETYPRTIA